MGGKEELLGYSNQIKISCELECLKDKKPVARQGFVPTILKCQHCSCPMAQGHIIFSGSGSLKISLWCKQVIQNLATQLVPCPMCMFLWTCCNIRLDLHTWLTGRGDTDTQLVSSRAEEEQWAVLMRRAAASTAPPGK